MLNLQTWNNMPKAKTYRNVRITHTGVPNLHKRQKKDGRPRGTLKRFQFEETRLGFMIKHEAPVVFNIIMNLTSGSIFPAPSCELIKLVCGASRDPSFKKAKFRRYLSEYETTGLYCKRGKELTPNRKLYYETIRKKKMKLFINRNKRKIAVLRYIKIR
jgi:hypothetical protein